MDYFFASYPLIGGKLKQEPEDFIPALMQAQVLTFLALSFFLELYNIWGEGRV